MKVKSQHEPNAKLLNAEDVSKDSSRVANALRQNLLNAEPAVQLEVPLSTFLSALDKLSRDEPLILSRRVEELLQRA
jgi:hypothetical protein